MSDRTKVISVHFLRRVARERERELQDEFDARLAGAYARINGLPSWARGVRVEKAGRFQWAVVVTEHLGH